MVEDKIIEFIKTTSDKLESVQGAYPYSFIHTHDENENTGFADDNLYIGEDRITDSLNLGETDPSSSTRKVGGLDVTTFGQLKQRSISEILIDILTPDPTVTSITLNETSISFEKGETRQLVATVQPSNAVDKSVTWRSSDTSVATVSSTGVVTAVKTGSAMITATAGTKSATCSMTVVRTEVSSVTLNYTSKTVNVGTSVSLTAIVNPSNATDTVVTWTSSDTSIATVSNGSVTTKGVGTVTITASCGGKSATCTIVVDPVLVSSVTVSPTSKTLYAGGTQSLSVTVSPSNATDKTVTWTSSDTSVATVSTSGLVTAGTTKAGTATITATANDGSNKSATCTITVRENALSHSGGPTVTIRYNGSTNNLTVDEGTVLPATGDIIPSYATGIWNDTGHTPYAGDPTGNITYTMKKGNTTVTDWGLPGEGGCTYTISASRSFAAGPTPINNFGQPATLVTPYPGGTVNSNTISIKVQDVFYINGYDTNGSNDNNDIFEMRKYTCDKLTNITKYITVPAESEEPFMKFKIQVSQQLSTLTVLQYNPLIRDYDTDNPIQMRFVSGNPSYYERSNSDIETKTSETKYKINLSK